MNAAKLGLPVKAVVSFHGMLNTQTPAQPGQIKARVLVETGADDQMAPAADIEAFKKEMTTAGVKYQVDIYPGAKHGFTNPEADNVARKFELPVGYNADADKKSWQAMQKLFKQVFGV